MTEAVEVDLHGDVAVGGHAGLEVRDRVADRAGVADERGGGHHLDTTVGEGGGKGFGARIEEPARCDLRRLDIGLVEGIDAQHHAGHGRRVLPRHEERAERSRQLDLVVVDLASRPAVGDQTHDLHIVGTLRQLRSIGADDHGENARAVLARRLGDQLLDPIAETHDVRAIRHDDELVASRFSPGDRCGQPKARIRLTVDGEGQRRRLGLVEKRVEIDPGEPGRNESEGGEGRVATAHRRVCREDAITSVERCLLER